MTGPTRSPASHRVESEGVTDQEGHRLGLNLDSRRCRHQTARLSELVGRDRRVTGRRAAFGGGP